MPRKQAHKFLLSGLHDKNKKDDIVKVTKSKVNAKDLKPIQKQIYYDKCIGPTAKFGIKNTTKFLTSSFMVTSADNFIIDGHHRWLSALLVDPNMIMVGIKIDLPIKKLIPIAREYGDAKGNIRNK